MFLAASWLEAWSCRLRIWSLPSIDVRIADFAVAARHLSYKSTWVLRATTGILWKGKLSVGFGFLAEFGNSFITVGRSAVFVCSSVSTELEEQVRKGVFDRSPAPVFGADLQG